MELDIWRAIALIAVGVAVLYAVSAVIVAVRYSRLRDRVGL